MRLKSILLVILLAAYTLSGMERKEDSIIKNIIIEPASLVFQATWHAIINGQPLQHVGETNIIELGNKIKRLQQCTKLTALEKIFFINLISNPNLDTDQIKNNFDQTVKKYLPNQSFESKAQLLNAILMEGVSHNKNDLVQLAIDAGANVNIKHKYAGTALNCAASWGKTEIVKTLIAAGANVNPKNTKGETPLMQTTSAGRTEIAQLLINAGAKVNFKDKRGYTALHSAAHWGRKELIQILVNSGANVNVQNRDGDTPLMIIIDEGFVKNKEAIVRILLDANASKKIKNKSGYTALDLAKEEGYTNIIKMLQK